MAQDAPRSPAGEPEDPAHELWRKCRGSPGIFDHWMKLITHLEAAGEPARPALRMAYEEFLVMFPLCYGFVRKPACSHECARMHTHAVRP